MRETEGYAFIEETLGRGEIVRGEIYMFFGCDEGN